jgi:serine phosphatase RsbU (regulator of sigma subunit)
VGGDYYDYFRFRDGKYCLTIGDATGHGLAAGLVVGMIKMATAVWLTDSSSDLSGMLTRFNSSLKACLRDRRTGMGLGVMVLDPVKGKARFAFSGMPYPYHYRHAAGTLEPLVMKGPPLGFFRRLEVQTHEVQLAPGDYLVFLSDGLPERFNKNDELWGNADLEACLAKDCNAGEPVANIAENLFTASDNFAEGRGNEDDMTVVVLRFRPREAAALAEENLMAEVAGT